MRLHVIQHVAFEGPVLIGEWAAERVHELTSGLALTEEFPAVEDVDFLVVMGGPMAADDEVASPWLRAEKHYVAETIAAGRLVLGVCLGAQIVAEVLGGTVKRNPEPEIGWYSMCRTPAGLEEPLLDAWPETMVVGQWHGDTFDLPAGLDPLMSSAACANQGFVFDTRVVGLQFHLEWTLESLLALVAACRDELVSGRRWVMSATEIEDEAPERVASSRAALFALLDAMELRGPGVAGIGG